MFKKLGSAPTLGDRVAYVIIKAAKSNLTSFNSNNGKI